MESMQRLELVTQLRAARAALQSGVKGVEKLDLLIKVRELRLQLGAKNAATNATSNATSTPEYAQNKHFQVLQAITSGAHDAQGLAELFGLMQSAILALRDDGLLGGAAVDAANAAITHWGELDAKLNG